jgi:hypothetical protein
MLPLQELTFSEIYIIQSIDLYSHINTIYMGIDSHKILSKKGDELKNCYIKLVKRIFTPLLLLKNFEIIQK